MNHWSIINWCVYDPSNPSAGGRYEHTQVIKIIDTQDPVLTVLDSLCFGVDGMCESEDIVLSGSAVDEGDCGSEWISWDVNIDLYSDWTNDHHYATTLPRLLSDGSPNPYYIAKTANGESANILLPAGIPTSKLWHRGVWRAYDGCGNTMSVTRYFQITDKKKPTPYCLNLSTAFMSNGEVELWAIDFNVGSFDNCTDAGDLFFTFTDVPPPPRDDTEYDGNDDLMWYNGTFWYYNSEEIDPETGAGEYEKIDAYGDEIHRWEPGLRSAGKVFTTADADVNGFAQVPIYVWDECGNIDFCLVNLRLVDNGGNGMARVSGNVVTEYGEKIEQVETSLSGPIGYNKSVMTNANGEYAFYDNPMYSNYAISGQRYDNYLNGVNTLDLLAIQQHVLGTELLDSGYKMIAADANGDKEISGQDLLELRKLILGIYNELPNNGSWKVINADDVVTVSNPWNYTEQREIADLDTDMTQEDFIGVKIGDVDASAQTGYVSSTTSTSKNVNAIEMNYEDKEVESGEEVEIVLSANRSDIYGYQFTMEMGSLELVEVVGGGLTEEHVGVFANQITMSYAQEEMMGGELMRLKLRATKSGQISEMLSVSSDKTRAEAYVGQNKETVQIGMRGDNAQETMVLYQNEPNPFNGETVIGFDLVESGVATISLYDVTGKELHVIRGEYVIWIQ